MQMPSKSAVFCLALALVVLLPALAKADGKEELINRVKQWELSRAAMNQFIQEKKNNQSAQMPSNWSGDEQAYRDFEAAIGDSEVSDKAGLGHATFYGLVAKVLSHPHHSRLTTVIINTLADQNSSAGQNFRVIFQSDRSREGRLLIGYAMDQVRNQGGDPTFFLRSLLENSLRDAPVAEISWSLNQRFSGSLQTEAERAIRFRHEPELFTHILDVYNSDPDPYARIAALDMLGNRRDAKTLALLKTALQDEKGGVNRLALTIL